MEYKTKEIKLLCIVKVDNTKFVKYHCINLQKFEIFLDRVWKGWRYYNVFQHSTRLQIASYTSKRRFTS